MAQEWFELLMTDHETTEKVLEAMGHAFQNPKGPSPDVVVTVLEYLTIYVDNCHNKKEEDHLFPLIERCLAKEPGRRYASFRELRADLDEAYSLIPGRHRLNLHAFYGEFGGIHVDRDTIGLDHFRGREPPGDLPGVSEGGQGEPVRRGFRDPL